MWKMLGWSPPNEGRLTSELTVYVVALIVQSSRGSALKILYSLSSTINCHHYNTHCLGQRRCQEGRDTHITTEISTSNCLTVDNTRGSESQPGSEFFHNDLPINEIHTRNIFLVVTVCTCVSLCGYVHVSVCVLGGYKNCQMPWHWGYRLLFQELKSGPLNI